ncbi:MAG TPA: isocitrate lyase/phosphoenolpyruvate mutase family protein [Candidatus Binatia bacterium]|jgi:2-methylisocitrate lyase-like PEP mutase family enzyme
MATPAQKADSFRALHHRACAFVMPNPWDAGSAHLLAKLGFEALATTSAGFAFSAGRRDGTTTRDDMLAHARCIAAATALPVSADMENGFGDDPDAVAEAIRLVAGTGVAGASIEDATGREGDPIHAKALAVERVRAAAEAARSAGFALVLTARAENFLHGRHDLADTIARLQSYQEAGADVLYAPGLRTRAEIETVVRSVDRPVNVLAGSLEPGLDVAALSAIGVRRISIGSALARAALTTLLSAAGEMRERGTFDFAQGATSYRDLSLLFD